MAELKWLDEMEARPAPVILAAASGGLFFLAYIAHSPMSKALYVPSIILGFYAIQITIWRAAAMITERLSDD